MFKQLPATYKGIICALIGYTGFAFSDAAVKVVTAHYSVYQIILIDMTLASIILLIAAPFLGGLKSLRDPGNYKVHALRAFFNFTVSVSVVYSFAHFPLTTVYTAGFFAPFIAVPLAMILYREHVCKHRWATIFAGFMGVLIAFRPWGSSYELLAVAALITLPVSVAGMHVIVRSFKSSSLLAMSFYPLFISCLLTLPLAVMDFHAVQLAHLPYFLISGFGIGAGLLGLAIGFQKADASVAAPLQYSQMVWGLLFGWLIFGDMPDLWMMVGATIIIISGIVLVQMERIKGSSAGAASPNTPSAS